MAAIVAAVDFSPPSRKAFDAAVGLAEDLGARLVLLHAFAPAPRAGTRDPIGQAKAEIDMQEWLELSKQWAAAARRRVDVECVAREGRPHEVVRQVAEEAGASLVVVGSHGRTGLKRAVLGSVAEAVVRGSKVPVVVVPA